ncbi:MAG TPA: sigma-70 family RNA polymerase sigma factor [Puia sp.]|jgi:RNA polymerase sigma factor (sigma-70 family)|nr:sigma-70 family RNA polymerase sigma factor [Puia sp.]
MDEVQLEADQLYKSHFGKMVSSLLHFSDAIDLKAAEDLVQDSFSAALISWRKDGLPVNTAAWLFRVCKNKALNKIKESKRFSNLFIDEAIHPGDPTLSKFPLDDQQLILLFACAHPDLSPKVQVVITLKYVVNLKVEAIAKILGMTVDGIDKLLVRVRQKIKNEKILFFEPVAEELESRIHIVHKILYLIFNEGYKSSWGKELIREELCEEGLLMTRALLNSTVGNKETSALYALMLFNASRFKARFGTNGELLDLEEQDRTLWNKELIQLGFVYLERSRGDTISEYHYEATIAGMHCSAESFAATDWKTITNLYNYLLKINPNPFVKLNYAIALYYAGQKNEALAILHKLETEPFFNQYYLLHASLGRIYFAEGNHALAKKYFTKTLRLTNSSAEKGFIMRLTEKIIEKDR